MFKLGALLDLARRFLAESLFKNSAFLMLNLVLTTVCGYGALTLLTHLFSAKDVGLSATAVAACSLVTFITQLGTTYSLPRYLPTAKNRAEMINTLLTAVTVSTLVGSIIFLALPSSRNLFVLGGWIFCLVFIATTVLQALQTVIATILVADRSSDKVATWGIIPNVSKLAGPPAFAALGGLGAFTARVIADLFGVATFGAILARSGHRFRVQISMSVTKEMAKFSSGMYVASLIGGLPQLILPLIVLSRIGATQAAYWSIAISIAAIIYSLPSTVTQALLPEVSLRPTERRDLLKRSTLMIAAFMVPALSFAFWLAPIGLVIFGKTYVTGTIVPLRWLIASGFVTMLNYVTGAILFIAKKSTMVTIVNVVDAIIVLGITLLWATNVTDVAIAWMIGDVGNTVLFAVFAFYALRQVGGRWEDLGGVTAPAAAEEPIPRSLSATTQMRSLSMLLTLSEQQETADIYKPYHNTLTDSQGLFSIVALQAAERQRQRFIEESASPDSVSVSDAGTGTGTGGDADADADGPQTPDESAAQHRQALELLFSLAERQREPAQPDQGN
jgi:O-antigen/teichoic acid export membrane protein